MKPPTSVPKSALRRARKLPRRATTLRRPPLVGIVQPPRAGSARAAQAEKAAAHPPKAAAPSPSRDPAPSTQTRTPRTKVAKENSSISTESGSNRIAEDDTYERPAKAVGCKKYFASAGMTLSVPCE